MTEYKEIELRSEEVQEVMDQIPSWMVRWGVTILFIMILLLLIGSYFFKHPDVITTDMILTSTHPTAQVVARSSGRISKLYVADGERVTLGHSLAIIENPALTENVEKLDSLLSKTIQNPNKILQYLLPVKDLLLGEIQSSYISYLRSLQEYENYIKLNYYTKKIASNKRLKEKYHIYYANIVRQKQIIELQYKIAEQQYTRDSLLFSQQIISPSEYETSQKEWLQSRYSLEGATALIDNLKIQIGELEENLLDLELEQMEKENILIQTIQTTSEQLHNAIHSWKLNYRLTTPITGIVTFTKYWSVNQNITSGEIVFTIVPEETEELIGVALLPIQRAGKVKVGQHVIIRFINYPDQEFGTVKGKVNSISLVPNNSNYRVEIALPEGLITNYKRKLPASQDMQAVAEIVTDELRLIEQFFMPLKKILKERFEI